MPPIWGGKGKAFPVEEGYQEIKSRRSVLAGSKKEGVDGTPAGEREMCSLGSLDNTVSDVTGRRKELEGKDLDSGCMGGEAARGGFSQYAICRCKGGGGRGGREAGPSAA